MATCSPNCPSVLVTLALLSYTHLIHQSAPAPLVRVAAGRFQSKLRTECAAAIGGKCPGCQERLAGFS